MNRATRFPAIRVSRQILVALFLLLPPFSLPAVAQTNWQSEWSQRQEAAKKEGKIVFSIPPSVELRKALETIVPKRLGFEVEIVPAAAGRVVRRIADEYLPACATSMSSSAPSTISSIA